jgi:hypothetical protein
MFQLRWYHLFVVLALCMAGVILLSLELHQAAYKTTARLLDAATRLDEKPRWFKRIEQCILELNSPGNDVFASNDLASERARLLSARAKLDEELKADEIHEVDLRALQARIEAMTAAAKAVFDHLDLAQKPGASLEEQPSSHECARNSSNGRRAARSDS